MQNTDPPPDADKGYTYCFRSNPVYLTPGNSMTRKQDDLRAFVIDVYEEVSRSKDVSFLHSIVNGLGEFETSQTLKLLLGLALLDRNWDAAELCLKVTLAVLGNGTDSDSSAHMWAVISNMNDCPDVLEWLVRYGADIEWRGTSNVTPLMDSASRGLTENVNVLLKCGADVKASTNIDDDNTALHLAAAYGHRAIVETLVKHGADVHHRNCWGKEAMDLAMQNGHEDVVLYLQEQQDDQRKLHSG